MARGSRALLPGRSVIRSLTHSQITRHKHRHHVVTFLCGRHEADVPGTWDASREWIAFGRDWFCSLTTARQACVYLMFYNHSNGHPSILPRIHVTLQRFDVCGSRDKNRAFIHTYMGIFCLFFDHLILTIWDMATCLHGEIYFMHCAYDKPKKSHSE